MIITNIFNQLIYINWENDRDGGSVYTYSLRLRKEEGDALPQVVGIYVREKGGVSPCQVFLKG